MDALRADAGQRRQLARRVKQLSSADSSKLAQQLLKQENAVRDAAPARRDALPLVPDAYTASRRCHPPPSRLCRHAAPPASRPRARRTVSGWFWIVCSSR